MGVRSYLEEIKITQTEDENYETQLNINIVKEIYLGKLFAYLSPGEIKESEAFDMLKRIDHNKEDEEYFKQFEEYGFCNEYPLYLNCILSGLQVTWFLLYFYNDKHKFNICPFTEEDLDEISKNIELDKYYLLKMHGA